MPDYLVQIYVRQPHGKPDGVVAVVHLVPVCECARGLVLLRRLLHRRQLERSMLTTAKCVRALFVSGLDSFSGKPVQVNHSSLATGRVHSEGAIADNASLRPTAVC